MERGVIHIHLAYAHRKNWNGPRQDNLKFAISFTKLALDAIIIDEAPIEWANSAVVFGQIFLDIESGDLNKKAEDALTLLTRILEIYSEENMPKEWAKLQKCLGDALYLRIAGNRKENLKKSVSHYENSMAFYKKERMKFLYSEAQMSWARAKLQSGEHGVRADFELSVYCFLKRCLPAFNKDETPLQRGFACFNLAQALSSNTQLPRKFIAYELRNYIARAAVRKQFF